MNTIAAPGVHELPSAEIQIGIAVLEALAPMYPNLAFVRQAGLTVTVPEHIEAAYVAKHGEKGQWLIDVILGRKETVASVNVRVRMRLEDLAEPSPGSFHSSATDSSIQYSDAQS